MDRTILNNLERLEAVLAQSLERQRQLGVMLDRKREALRSGDTEAMADLCRLQGAAVQTIAELEKRRAQLVADLTVGLDPSATQPLPMRELAERLPEPHRGRLLVMRTRLVEAMEQVREQTSVARRASESLLSHVNGLMRTIGTAARGGAAYAQTGKLHTRSARLSTINFTA